MDGDMGAELFEYCDPEKRKGVKLSYWGEYSWACHSKRLDVETAGYFRFSFGYVILLSASQM